MTTYTIKPLVWESCEDGYTAITPFGRYVVERYDGPCCIAWFKFKSSEFSREISRKVGVCEKSAITECENDWEGMIKQALVPV
jgi:hypothetical protein